MEDDNNLPYNLLFSATAAKNGRHKREPGIEDKCIKAIYSFLSLIASKLIALLSPF
jgi:hypothetical protein